MSSDKIRDPVSDQHSAAGARLPGGHGAVDPDLTPILLPVMMNFGVDPVHFGMIMMLNLGIGLCHPPVGAILFVGCAVGKVTIEAGHARDLAVLRRDVRGADAGHLYSGDLAVAAENAVAVILGRVLVCRLSTIRS